MGACRTLRMQKIACIIQQQKKTSREKTAFAHSVVVIVVHGLSSHQFAHLVLRASDPGSFNCFSCSDRISSPSSSCFLVCRFLTSAAVCRVLPRRRTRVPVCVVHRVSRFPVLFELDPSFWAKQGGQVELPPMSICRIAERGPFEQLTELEGG